MKKPLVLLLVAAFLFIGAQVLATPPVTLPKERFIIKSVTGMEADGNVTETESFNWTYFEGWGRGVFYPFGYAPSQCACAGCCADLYDGYVVSELGFTEGAEVAYEQDFTAVDGFTVFTKQFGAYSFKVKKTIEFLGHDPDTSYAKHNEKVGLSVISMGASDRAGRSAGGFLTLCPWAENGNGTTGGGYPPTNAGIAAGSSFEVTWLEGFRSDSVVNSWSRPALSYKVTGQGEGNISAGFVVELWEGPAGYVWAPVKVSGLKEGDPLYGCIDCDPQPCDPRAGRNCYLLPEVLYGQPPLASRASYAEHASAEGVWTFTKQVSYQSLMPAAPAAGTFPFNQVP